MPVFNLPKEVINQLALQMKEFAHYSRRREMKLIRKMVEAGDEEDLILDKFLEACFGLLDLDGQQLTRANNALYERLQKERQEAYDDYHAAGYHQ